MNITTSTGRKALAAAGAIALLATGCSNGNDGSGTGNRSSNGPVAEASVNGTSVLEDADGHTLYTADVEKGGHIRCVDACTSFWVPVAGSSSDIKTASGQIGHELGVVDRPDGTSQLTYDGKPVYTFAEEGAGELRGNGFTDDFQGTHFVWSAVSAHGSAAPAAPDTSGGGGGYGY
jgi:predicted lipoprotein with Yx(FWY)xxD motif